MASFMSALREENDEQHNISRHFSEMSNIEIQLLYFLIDYMHNCAYNIKMEFE
jgi:hypothetical protein